MTRPPRKPRSPALTALTLTLTALLPGPAQAGSRTAEIVALRLDGTQDKAAAACFSQVLAALRQGDVKIRVQPTEGFLARAGQPDPKALLTWPGSTLRAGARVPKDADQLDAVIAVDCRPADGVLRVVLANARHQTDAPPTLRFEAQDRGPAAQKPQRALIAALLDRLVWRDMIY